MFALSLAFVLSLATTFRLLLPRFPPLLMALALSIEMDVASVGVNQLLASPLFLGCISRPWS